MGRVGRLACQGFLVRCSGAWNLISFLWSEMECPVMSFEMVYVLGVTMGSLYVDVQGYVPALLENLHGMSCSKTYWLLGGGWFQCRYGGFWTVCYYLKFHVVSSFLMFSGFVLKSPASGFQFYCSSTLNTSTIQHC